MQSARRSLLLIVPFLLPAALAAQAVNAKPQITALENAWIKAVVARDAAAFERMLAPGFVYTENDRLYSKADLIKDLTTSQDTVTDGENEGMVIRVYGNAAIATGWLVLRGRNSSGPFERHYRYTDTWVKSGGRWRAIAAQDYLKP